MVHLLALAIRAGDSALVEIGTILESLAADPAAVAALGIAGEHIESIRTQAHERLAARPISMLGDC